VKADVIVHEHCGEASAIGAALEAGRLWDNGRQTTFIGLDACATIQYKTTREEATRCYFCKNKSAPSSTSRPTRFPRTISGRPRPRCRSKKEPSA
jgi:hypothetical protein